MWGSGSPHRFALDAARTAYDDLPTSGRSPADRGACADYSALRYQLWPAAEPRTPALRPRIVRDIATGFAHAFEGLGSDGPSRMQAPT